MTNQSLSLSIDGVQLTLISQVTAASLILSIMIGNVIYQALQLGRIQNGDMMKIKTRIVFKGNDEGGKALSEQEGDELLKKNSVSPTPSWMYVIIKDNSRCLSCCTS